MKDKPKRRSILLELPIELIERLDSYRSKDRASRRLVIERALRDLLEKKTEGGAV